MSDETKPLKHIAYHEAGHAAAQLILGQSPSVVTIVPRGESLGSAHHMDGDDLTAEGMRDLVINCYAGREAEIRVGGDGSGSCRDDEQAEEYLQHVGTEEELRTATAEFVSNHWPLIKLIAVDLLKHMTLGMEELVIMLDIYHGEATEDDLSDYRNSFVHQRELERRENGGFARGAT
jgi:hypothetical protein